MILFDYVFWAMAMALVVLGVAVGLQAVNLARLRSAVHRDVQRLFEQMDLTLGELRDVSASIATARAAPAGVPSAPSPAPQPPLVALPPATAAARSYDIALRLARNGASREELMSNCGMSRHEAELAVRLHGPARLQSVKGGNAR